MQDERLKKTQIGEIYNGVTGISRFTVAECGLPDPKEVYADLWLPEHSGRIVEMLEMHGGVTLIGEVGSGKSALLYGIRRIMQVNGTSYIFINGHFTNSESTEVNEVIDGALNNGMAVIYDSGDYLVGGNKKVRQLSLDKHLVRSLTIMEKLTQFRQEGGKLLLTSHNENWVNDMAHPDLIPAWTELLNYTHKENIAIFLENHAERAALLEKTGLPADISSFIAGLPNNPGFLDHIINTKGDKKYTQWAVERLQRYQTLKLLSKDTHGENEFVLEVVKKTLEGRLPEYESWEAILNFIYSKTYRLLFHTKL